MIFQIGPFKHRFRSGERFFLFRINGGFPRGFHNASPISVIVSIMRVFRLHFASQDSFEECKESFDDVNSRYNYKFNRRCIRGPLYPRQGSPCNY